jgi:hypothetical protein
MNGATKALLPPPAMQNLHDPSGIGYADTLDPQVPLSVRVGPYLEINEGDVIDLYCDNQLAINYTVKREDLTPGIYNFVVLPLDQKFIRQDSITLLYEVTKPIGGQKNQSVPATIPVKLTLPGGTDTNPATPYENERLAKPKVSPEDVITSPEGVSVEIAPYMNMAVGDTITLSWHGELIRAEIADDSQVGLPVIIPVSKEIIDQAGDSDRLEVRYEIRDIVNNWSRWSLPVYLEVEAGESSLPAPVTPQAPDMELDLDRLSQADVQVLVIAHPDIQRGDELVLTVERNTPEGEPLEPYVASQTITSQSSFYGFKVPNAQFQPIAQGRARLQYRVYQQAGNALRSKSLTLNIVGSPMELALPRVPAAEQNEGVLDPASRNVIAIVPAYYFMSEGNDVHLFWMGKTQSGANVMHDELKTVASGDVGSQVDFSIPDDRVGLLAGGSVEVYYTVNTFNRAFFKSPSLVLRVSDDRDMPLPLPTILEADNDTLDPADTLNGATVVIGSSANLRVGDQVKVSWKGAKGSDEKETVIAADSAGNALSVVFSSALVNINEGERVSVEYTVQRASGIVQTSDVFRVTIVPSLSALPAPSMDKVEPGGTLDPGLIPATGAIVRVKYDMRTGDRVKVVWTSASRHETDEQTVSGETVLAFTVPKRFIDEAAGSQGNVGYEVMRGGSSKTSASLTVHVQQPLTLNTSPVTLNGKIYLLMTDHGVFPRFPAGTTVQRQASGGRPPYVYRSSNPAIVHVDQKGLASVRRNGNATITVQDSAGHQASYAVRVTGTILCSRLIPNTHQEVTWDAQRNNARLPTLTELKEIYAAYGARWPLDKSWIWASTNTRLIAKAPIKHFGNGQESQDYVIKKHPGLGLHLK